MQDLLQPRQTCWRCTSVHIRVDGGHASAIHGAAGAGRRLQVHRRRAGASCLTELRRAADADLGGVVESICIVEFCRIGGGGRCSLSYVYRAASFLDAHELAVACLP